MNPLERDGPDVPLDEAPRELTAAALRAELATDPNDPATIDRVAMWIDDHPFEEALWAVRSKGAIGLVDHNYGMPDSMRTLVQRWQAALLGETPATRFADLAPYVDFADLVDITLAVSGFPHYGLVTADHADAAQMVLEMVEKASLTDRQRAACTERLRATIVGAQRIS